MPIRLNEPNKVKTYSPQEGVTFRYREARTSDVLRASRSARSADSGPDIARAETELVARSLVGWEGLEAADGAPLPFAERVEDRVLVVEALPVEVALKLCALVQERAREAAASGKDSPKS